MEANQRSILRAVFCALVIVCPVSCVVGRVAWGAMSERTLRLARQFDGINVPPGGAVNVLEVNGQTIRVATGLSEQSIGDVLDRFATVCRQSPQMIWGTTEEIRTSETPEIAGVPVLRQQSESEGLQACLVPARTGASTGWTARWRDFGRTRDLSSLGVIVFVYARHTNTAQVHVMKAWTGDNFHLLDMFPSVGDSPGSDSAWAARPRSARRTLSGIAGGTSYAVRFYETLSTPEQTLSNFDADMAARGYTRMDDTAFPPGVRGYLHSTGAHVLATAARERGATIVSVAETGVQNQPLITNR